MDYGYVRVSAAGLDLDRQQGVLTAAGVDPARIYVDEGAGVGAGHPGLDAMLAAASAGDVVVVCTLDRLGRTVPEVLGLLRGLFERGIGIRTLADPVRIDSSNPDDPAAALLAGLLTLFAQMDRAYAIDRAAHARTAAAATGRRGGRPRVVSTAQIEHATRLRDAGATIAEITRATGLTRSTLYRHLPRRAPGPTSAPATSVPAPSVPAEAVALRQADRRDRLACPTCGRTPTGRAQAREQRDDLASVWLHLDPQGHVRERRHCADCQPHGRVVLVECARCGDGPLLTGTLTDHSGRPVPVVTAWLAEHRWQTSPDLICPRHR